MIKIEFPCALADEVELTPVAGAGLKKIDCRNSSEMKTKRSHLQIHWFAILGVILSFAILLYNAATNTLFDDEAGGFFFAKLSPTNLISVLSQNEIEDPPLWYLVSHCWLWFAGRSVFSLRFLPLIFWISTFPAVYRLARGAANKKVAWISIALLSLLPYNWIYPASFRWYSMFTFLCVWNSVSLFEIMQSFSLSSFSKHAFKTRTAIFCLVYVLTGTAMCYTNYVAGAFFAAHFVFIFLKGRRHCASLIPLTISWLAIIVCFSPWLPIFLRQLGMSIQSFSVLMPAITLYQMMGGPFSTPNDILITFGTGLFGLCSVLMIFRRIGLTFFPLCILLVVLGAMIGSSTIGPTRILMLMPYFAISLAIAISLHNKTPWQKRIRILANLALMVIVIGSFVKLIKGSDWISYRWLAPTEQVVQEVKTSAPDAVIATTSNTVLFYLGDNSGQFRKKFAQLPSTDKSTPKGYYLNSIEDLPLTNANECVLIWEAGSRGPVSRIKNTIIRDLKKRGFYLDKTKSYLQMSNLFLRFHPHLKTYSAEPLDSMRFVVFYFKRKTAITMKTVMAAHV